LLSFFDVVVFKASLIGQLVENHLIEQNADAETKQQRS